MSEPIITALNVQNVQKVWPEVSKLLTPFLEEAKTHTLDDVLRMLMAGQAQLWIQWNGRIEVALVTIFAPYPRGLALRIWMAAAQNEETTNWEEWRVALVGFAASNNCVMIEAESSREGWAKVLGVKPVGYIYRVHLSE